jgi:hypothetical protein
MRWILKLTNRMSVAPCPKRRALAPLRNATDDAKRIPVLLPFNPCLLRLPPPLCKEGLKWLWLQGVSIDKWGAGCCACLSALSSCCACFQRPGKSFTWHQVASLLRLSRCRLSALRAGNAAVFVALISSFWLYGIRAIATQRPSHHENREFPWGGGARQAAPGFGN